MCDFDITPGHATVIERADDRTRVSPGPLYMQVACSPESVPFRDI